VSACRATDCGKAIPSGQAFCKRCLNVLSDAARHRVLFSDRSERAVLDAVAELDRLRGFVSRTTRTSSPPSPARERFRAAREHAASALAILDSRPRRT
jgi:hypothetical protein